MRATLIGLEYDGASMHTSFDDLAEPNDASTGGLFMEQQDPMFPRKPLRAAQYVRMSTEHQQYSTENQSEVIARYAAQHGMEICDNLH
jgi:hypothetical protein